MAIYTPSIAGSPLSRPRCAERPRWSRGVGRRDQTVGATLDGFGDLPDADRELLFETFRVWQDSDASVRGAAEVLICHPNTVRHRLRRIEQRTGRSLTRPRDVAELCLAFEVHRRLM
jgi:DNA-binding PucR family transcriptional regulator